MIIVIIIFNITPDLMFNCNNLVMRSAAEQCSSDSENDDNVLPKKQLSLMEKT